MRYGRMKRRILIENIDAVRACFNCRHSGGDKTDHTEKNPCTNCDVKWSLGWVDLVPNGGKIKWMPLEKMDTFDIHKLIMQNEGSAIDYIESLDDAKQIIKMLMADIYQCQKALYECGKAFVNMQKKLN